MPTHKLAFDLLIDKRVFALRYGDIKVKGEQLQSSCFIFAGIDNETSEILKVSTAARSALKTFKNSDTLYRPCYTVHSACVVFPGNDLQI